MFSDYFLGTKHSYDFRTDKRMQKNICRHIQPASHRLAAKTCHDSEGDIYETECRVYGANAKTYTLPVIDIIAVTPSLPVSSRGKKEGNEED